MARKPLTSEQLAQTLSDEEITKRMSFWVHEVGNGKKTARDLTLAEVEQAIRYILDGKSSEAQTGVFLVAMRIKGSSDDERFGFLNVLRDYNEPANFQFPDLLDYSSFYDGRDGELHFSPAIALVAAAAGARVVLTTGDSRNNNTLHRILLQDVLQALGIRVNRSLQEVGKGLESLKVGVVNTHLVNKALNNPDLLRIRRDIGLRTPLDTMEISLNPANARYHIRGLFHPRSKDQIPRIMVRSGITRGLMIRGIAGSGEASTHMSSEVFEVIGSEVRTFTLDPTQSGLSKGRMEDITSADVKDQAEKTVRILEGKAEGTLRDITVLNAGLVLYTSEKAESIEKGIALAGQALRSKEPLRLLNAWRKA